MTSAIAPTSQIDDRELPFHARVDWDSFNELAKDVGSAGLRSLEPGTLAHLRVKQDAFVVARETDFQILVGLASDAARLQRMLNTISEGLDIAVERQDNRILDWLRGVAHELTNSLRPAAQRDLAAELMADLDDDEPAPRKRRGLAAAH
jgi:hypothetical protein